ncbi:MAG: helix-turn-helix transcriptional regulator, partial [Eubacteriales bacterium]
MEFNDRLKVLRETNGLTQAEIAQYVGVSRPTISGYETRGYQPSHEKLNKLAEIFSVSIDYLLNGGPQDNELLQRHNERNKQLRITLSQR